jgi:Family of unknown function (DUF6085)
MPPIRDVVGYCPMGCGPHLHVMSGGMIMCLAPGCPDPGSVTGIISDPETNDVVEFTDERFTVLHPLRERLSGNLFGCPVNQAVLALDDPPDPGRYRARLGENGKLVLEPLPEQG